MRIMSVVLACTGVVALGIFSYAQFEQSRMERAFPGMAQYKAMLAETEIERQRPKVAQASNRF